MTSPEHVFSDQLQQHQHEGERGYGYGKGEGEGEVRAEEEEVGEVVCVGVAVSGDGDENAHVEGGKPTQDDGEREPVSIVVIGDEGTGSERSGERADEEDEGGILAIHDLGAASASASGVSLGVDVSESVTSRSSPLRGRLSGVSPPDSAFRSRSGSSPGSPSQSQSPSPSVSLSRSRSPSRSSIKEVLEMGESSAATSWTQADRPSGDSEQQPSADQPVEGKLVPSEEAVDVQEKEAGGVVFGLGQLRANTSGDFKMRREELLVVQEEDVGEGWHPLRYNGKERSQEDEDSLGEKEVVEKEEDVGSVGPVESTQGGKPSLEMNEKDRWRAFGSAGRNARHLRLEFKSPSPHPWDETDRQTENNETYMSDYYSTLNSKKFGTLQKSRRRPLIPHSAYYFGPPAADAAYGTSPVGQIGVHHPREMVRIERDYGGGELPQFSPVYPLELEGRITPTQFLQTINDINEILISAHSVRRAFLDNFLAVITLQLSTLVVSSHYMREMRRLKRKMDELNTQVYNPVGLNLLWPQKVAFLFLEIEYY